MSYLPDGLALGGLLIFSLGIASRYGTDWAAIVVGAVLLVIGLAAAWKRSN